MHSKPTLTSIPERIELSEIDDDVVKWVSRKKHEVLKAKYKCLKKLFQIYDASVIGILPQTHSEDSQTREDEQKILENKSRHTKTDASVEVFNANKAEKSAANAVIKDLKLDKTPSSELNKSRTVIHKRTDDKSTQDSKENISIGSVKDNEIKHHPVPYLVINEKRKPTRFQSFIQRILGIRRERYTYVMSDGREYASSDNNISNRYEKRRRRSLKFRRTRRPKKTHSETALGNVKSPVIMSYVQSMQRNCLMDTSQRQCPIVGCKMLLYGIINYNDHLNLCHFPERTYCCVYCHEGFTSERVKAAHEHEHIGITKLPAVPSTARFSTKIASNTQTEPETSKLDIPEEKLKKIVSFFDKISDPDQAIADVKRNRRSETNLQMLHRNPRIDIDSCSGSDNQSDNNSDSEKSSSVLKTRSKLTSTSEENSRYGEPPVSCQLCGENFDYRRQLNLHMETHHHNRFTKYNSCAGILNRGNRLDNSQVQTATQSLTRSFASTDVSDETKLSRRKSDETLTYDPSTNIVYYTSMESVRKPSFVQKVRSGFFYKWEPGTKIIRV